MAVGAALDLRVSWMGKHTLFAPPLGTVMRAFGGVAVDRTKRSNTVQSAIDLLRTRDELFLIVAPEGTRARARWKTGFYHIALGANVPILCGFLDFATKTGGLGDLVYPTGNIETDLGKVRAFYAGIQGKRPERCGEIELAPPRAPAQAPSP
jgi:1-acyl-sn-glycerol-3-phosphate acyltransferase